MSFDLNILVNGNRCKQYNHQGKIFIEAKNGSEYVVQINNNHWKRVLAVGSVDGLNILTGKTASEKDSGYIVGAYSSEKIKGFRFSDTEWAMFKFGYKFNGNTYAQSKEDGSERNCGVIGLRIFYEKEPIYTTTTHWYDSGPCYITGATNHIVNYCCSDLGTRDINDTLNAPKNTNYSSLVGGTGIASAASPTKGGNNTPRETLRSSEKISKKRSIGGGGGIKTYCDSNDFMPEQPTFDMGTEWGRKEQSKVHNVSFERGCQAQSFDIYYASRETLIAMGVPLFNELQVGLPQSFPNGYATPPKNWVG